jgi:SMC interacting uncharacterized protein involved in chromosome segregation
MKNHLKLISEEDQSAEDQEIEALEYELAQLYLFESLSYSQQVKFLRGRDVNEVFDKQFQALNRARKKIILGLG